MAVESGWAAADDAGRPLSNSDRLAADPIAHGSGEQYIKDGMVLCSKHNTVSRSPSSSDLSHKLPESTGRSARGVFDPALG